MLEQPLLRGFFISELMNHSTERIIMTIQVIGLPTLKSEDTDLITILI